MNVNEEQTKDFFDTIEKVEEIIAKRLTETADDVQETGATTEMFVAILLTKAISVAKKILPETVYNDTLNSSVSFAEYAEKEMKEHNKGLH